MQRVTTAARRHREQPRSGRVKRAGVGAGLKGPEAFINLPYHGSYTKLYLAYIAGLSALGFVPTTAPDIPGSERQLNRITQLITRSAYSVHDLSWPAKSHLRLNMSFELGLAVGLGQARRSHRWLIFDATPHRLARILSDIAGTNVYPHRRSPNRLLYQLDNAVRRAKGWRPTPADLRAIYKKLSTLAEDLQRRYRVKTLFDTRPFGELVYGAYAITARYRAQQEQRHRNKSRPR